MAWLQVPLSRDCFPGAMNRIHGGRSLASEAWFDLQRPNELRYSLDCQQVLWFVFEVERLSLQYNRFLVQWWWKMIVLDFGSWWMAH